MLSYLELFPVIGTVAAWDLSSWDSGDVWSNDATDKIAFDLKHLLFPGLSTADKRYRNKTNDIDHLVGHLINCRDVFVTDDNGILRKADLLRVTPGIVVMTPSDCVDHLERIDKAKQRQSLVPSSTDTKFQSVGPTGQVAFDYSNNNHRFAIGNGLFVFETQWSKASNNAIHVYSDPPSIAAIALAKGLVSISDIHDASIFDYSSRTRTPSIGQIVIWQNVNGMYAATKVIDIKDDTRGAATDELTFEYVILTDGGANFEAAKK